MTTEIYGVAIYPLIIGLVAMLERYANLPSKYAGLIAFVLGSMLAAAYLGQVGKIGLELVVMSFGFGMSVPLAHQVIVEPFKLDEE